MFVPKIPVCAQPRLAPLDEAEQRRHKVRNWLHSALLLAGMAALLAACGWLLFGPGGMIWLGIGALLLLLFSPTVSPQVVLRLYRARPLQPAEAPALIRIIQALAYRARLEVPPRLHYVPSAMMNAFAVGSRDRAAIAITDGLIRRLSQRELTNVLAHEISHIRNNDLWLMNLADATGRLTRAMSLFGILVMALSMPMWLSGAIPIPVFPLLLLLFAPQIALLLQLALSRSREFDADLDAAGLTGDPEGLASALLKLERYQRGFIERLLYPGYRSPEPSLLRTHPPTDQRVARLHTLIAQQDHRRWVEPFGQPGWAGPFRLAAPPRLQPPQVRLIGFWH